MQFEGDSSALSKQRLLLATHSGLNDDEVFKDTARRWSIEDLFNQMKNGWGWRETWQQSRQVLLLVTGSISCLWPAANTEHVLQRLTMPGWWISKLQNEIKNKK